ncbi:DUF5683 domain-containing protein [Chryseolinea sp. T2]|uniref:DUF5683 domain-containing protein n=1 Tax=Chryseolinea sp. T2 TaxID=3129255 RepID=UPI003077C272
MRTGLLVGFILFFGLQALAQDSLIVKRDSALVAGDSTFEKAVADTVLLKSYAARYDPRKALLYAAVVPGMGQIYNKKYWKLPLVYGGFIGFAYGINFYQKGYIKYKNKLYYNLEHGFEQDGDFNPEDNPPYTTGNYRKIVDQYKRQRDFMIILMAGMYLLQIIDAHVDAHLKEFDLNPNLQVSVEPVLEQSAMLGSQKGFTVVLKF